MIRIVVNGQPRDVRANLSVAELLRELGVPREVAIVERNRAVVAREAYESVAVEAGDELELVRLMGGG